MKNIGQLMKQAQQMQQKMAEMQAELEAVEMTGIAGGGMVQLTLNGKGDLKRLKIDKSVVDPAETEVLEDLIVAAFNDARAKVNAHAETEMQKLTGGLAAAAAVRPCSTCGNLDTADPCAICRDPERDATAICVVEDLADLWALERTGAFRGRYHVLGGTLSALDGIGPDELNIARLISRLGPDTELILALNATVDGQTTAHYIADRAAATGAKISRLAQGVPIGGELDYLDEGTLTAALKARRAL